VGGWGGSGGVRVIIKNFLVAYHRISPCDRFPHHRSNLMLATDSSPVRDQTLRHQAPESSRDEVIASLVLLPREIQSPSAASRSLGQGKALLHCLWPFPGSNEGLTRP